MIALWWHDQWHTRFRFEVNPESLPVIAHFIVFPWYNGDHFYSLNFQSDTGKVCRRDLYRLIEMQNHKVTDSRYVTFRILCSESATGTHYRYRYRVISICTYACNNSTVHWRNLTQKQCIWQTCPNWIGIRGNYRRWELGYVRQGLFCHSVTTGPWHRINGEACAFSTPAT